ncbi:MAG TPA: cation:proton antiporter [Pyrinomonadaceae bacterium]|nr:cation:proton antiporter [Pyrinomonadaceae bacterium]
MPKIPAKALLVAGSVLLVVHSASAQSVTTTGAENHGLQPIVLIGLAGMLLVAKLGGEFFERIGQPAVLGELIGGIVVGNLVLFGFTAAEPLKTNVIVDGVAQIGVILLLFEVGLESNIDEMLEVGSSSLLVAVAGVVAPFFLGWGVSAYFLPNESRLVHIFIGSVLCATSVGITARVLKDLGKLKLRESRIILGAAVIDDVIGLLMLAVIIGAVSATTSGHALSFMTILWLGAKSAAFFVAAFAVGHYVVPPLFRAAGKFRSRGVLLVLTIAFCFSLSWLATKVGLAAIVGAFAAGLVLEEAHFKLFKERGEHDLQELLEPITVLLVPIFFVLIGMRVDLRAFAQPRLLGYAAALSVAAIIGKQICSLAVAERGLNRLAIGLGMIPRGEVGLIIASIGATVTMPNATGLAVPVIGANTFAAVVIMVLVTTLVTPPLLKAALSRERGRQDKM